MLVEKPIKGARLPPLFDEIVQHDRKLADVLSQPVIPISAHALVKRKRELVQHVQRTYLSSPNKDGGGSPIAASAAAG